MNLLGSYSSSYYTYGGSSSSAAAGGLLAGIFGFLAVIWVFALAVTIIMIIANWKIFTKAGREGWKAIIPIYNNWVLFEIAGMQGALSLLLFVPIANIVVLIMCYLNLAKVFGKDTGFAIGLILLNPIFVLILAFSKDIKYVGAGGTSTTGTGPVGDAVANAVNGTPEQKPADPWVNGDDKEQPQA